MRTKIEKNEIHRGDAGVAFKAGFWYTVSNFFAKAIALITTPIFARLMTVSDYGEFSNFANWGITLVLIASLELQNTLSRAYYDFKERYDDYISTVTILGGSVTFCLYVLFLLFPEILLKIVTIPARYIPLLFLFVLFTYCRGVYNARERTLYRYKSVAFITFISLFIPTILSVFLVYLLPTTDHLSARLYGFYLPSSLIGMYCAISLFRKSRAFKYQYCKYALVLSVPLLFHYLAAYLLTSTNIMISKNMLGAGAAAIVSIASSIIHIFTILSQSVSGALTTWLMDNLELNRKEMIRRGIFYYVAMLSVIIVFSILFTPEITYILGGEKYSASIVLIPGLLFAVFIQAVTAVFTIVLTYDKNVVKTAVYTGIVAIFSVIAKILILPDNEIVILAYVNIVAFGVLFLINYILVKKSGYAEVVNIKQMITVILLTGVFVIFSQDLYRFMYIRYALIGLFVLGLSIISIRNKKQVSAFIERIRNKKRKKKQLQHGGEDR